MASPKTVENKPKPWLVRFFGSPKLWGQGRNERKRKMKEIRACYTRKQWTDAWIHEVRKRLKENGLNRFGAPIRGLKVEGAEG